MKSCDRCSHKKVCSILSNKDKNTTFCPYFDPCVDARRLRIIARNMYACRNHPDNAEGPYVYTWRLEQYADDVLDSLDC